VEEREKNAFADIIGAVASTSPAQPKRPQPIHFYSRRWYDERVKARFEAVWEVEKQRAKDLSGDLPSEIKICNEVTREALKEESEDFKAEMQIELDAEHAATVKAWEVTCADTPAKTPQELNA
jgi:hypothetical protein